MSDLVGKCYKKDTDEEYKFFYKVIKIEDKVAWVITIVFTPPTYHIYTYRAVTHKFYKHYTEIPQSEFNEALDKTIEQLNNLKEKK